MGIEHDVQGRPKGSLGKNTKKNKKPKDPNKPKRSTSAYFFFLADCRKEHAKSGAAPKKIAEFTREASAKWNALSPDKKKPYEDAALKDKTRYEEEMAAYKGKTVDPNKPKRPPTAYFLFLADYRIRMQGKGVEHKELLKLAGEEWRGLSGEDKKPYEADALVESKKYEEKMTEYRKQWKGSSTTIVDGQTMCVMPPSLDSETDMDSYMNGGGASPAKKAPVAAAPMDDDDEEDEEDDEEDEEDEDDE